MGIIETLAQKNKDHYDNHPVSHTTMIVAMTVAAAGAFAFMGAKLSEIQERPRKIPG